MSGIGIGSGIRIGFGIEIGFGSGIGSRIDSVPELKSFLESKSAPEWKLTLKSESSSKRIRIRHIHKNRRLGPMMLRIDNRKESKFICKRSILLEMPEQLLIFSLSRDA